MEVKKIEIGSSTIFRVILIALGFWLVFLLREIIFLLIGAFVIASAIEPLARRLRRFRVPRAMSVVIVYLFVLFMLSLAVVLIAPAVAQQTAQLAQSLPSVWSSLQDKLGLHTFVGSDQVLQGIQSSLSKVSDNVGNVGVSIFKQTGAFVSGIFSIIFMLIIAFYLVLEEDALKKVFRLIVPVNHMNYIEMVIDRVQIQLGRWVLAQLVLAVVIGTTATIGLWLLGVQHALALGIFAGVLEIIPVIGPIVSGVVGTIIALSQSLFLGVGVAIFYVVMQQFENHFLVPNIMRKATGLNPLVTLIAILIGAKVAGTVGVILSVPIATIVSIIVSDFFRTASAPDEYAG